MAQWHSYGGKRGAVRGTSKHFVSMTSGTNARERTLPLEGGVILHVLFAVFCGSIAFETLLLSIEVETTLSFASITGYVFFVAAAYSGRISVRKVPMVTLVFFTGFLWIVCRSCFVEPLAQAGAWSKTRSLAQLLVLFVIAYNLLLHHSYRRVLHLSMIGSVCILVALQHLQVVDPKRVLLPGRASALAENPNTLGLMCCVATLITIHEWRRGSRGMTMKGVLIVAVAWLLSGLVASGSRGALVSGACGMLAYAMMSGFQRGQLRAVVMTVLVLGILTWFSISADVLRSRWDLVFEEGNVAGRSEIWTAAAEMFWEKPLVGWGPWQAQLELGARTGAMLDRDSHNIVLHVLIEGGLILAATMLLGFGVCVRFGVLGRNGPERALPLGLLSTILIASAFSNHFTKKILWILLAYSCCSGAQTAAVAVRSIRRGKSGVHSRSRKPLLRRFRA